MATYVVARQIVAVETGWLLPASTLAVGLMPASLIGFQLLLLPLAAWSYLRHGQVHRRGRKWGLIALAAAVGGACGVLAVEVETRNQIAGLTSYRIDTDRWPLAIAILVILFASLLNSMVEEGVWREALVELPTSRTAAIATASRIKPRLRSSPLGQRAAKRPDGRLLGWRLRVTGIRVKNMVRRLPS